MRLPVTFVAVTRVLVAPIVMLACVTCANALPALSAQSNAAAASSASSKTLTPESSANAEFRKGIAAQMKGNSAAAKAGFLAAIKINPKFAPALIGLAGIAQKDGDRDGAEKYLKQAEDADPKASDVQLAWGRFYLSTKQFDRAEQSFKSAKERSPLSIAPLLELGDLYLRHAARREDAVRSFRAAVELEPDNKFATYALGVALAVNGKRDEALAAFDKTASLAPTDPAPLRAAGRLYLEAGITDKALDAFDRGLKRQPNFVPLMLDRADALARQGKWADSIKQMLAAAQTAPKSAEVQVKLGDVYQGAVRPDDARSAYLKAVELDSGNPFAYNNLAWMTVQQGGAPAKAVEWARKAVALAPNSAPFYDTLGWSERAAGDLQSALKSLRRATELDPGFAEFQFHYGVVLSELKKNGDARIALEQALKLDPRFPKSDDARKLLRSLPAG